MLVTQVVLLVKNPPARAEDARDMHWIPGSGRFPGGGNGNPIQYSCLETSMDRWAWWATAHGVAESQIWLTTHACIWHEAMRRPFCLLVCFPWTHAKSLQSCPTLCNPIDGSPPGSPVPGILQARTLEWVAISFSNAWKWKVQVKLLSRVRLLATPWTAAYQAPLPMEFSRQEYWSGVPLPSPYMFRVGVKSRVEWVSGTADDKTPPRHLKYHLY